MATVWLVYAAFLTTNVVRETYLAVALGGDYTIRVDPYLGLHPDLFEIPGRGGFINSNPGASLLGAVPYAAARPFIAGVFTLRPDLAAPKPPTRYEDPRPNRTNFMNEMRARGLDVRLALAAIAIQVGLMAPLGALAVLALFRYLRARGEPERAALGWSLLYAFATPLLFRSAFLNQNALLAHVVLGAWILLTAPLPGLPASRRPGRWAAAGALLGFGLVLDYSAAPLALVLGAAAVAVGWRDGGWRSAARLGGACLAGAIGPVVLLLGYQWAAFGVPWYPAQRYMPPTELSVQGWNGLAMPSVDLLWRNLVDPRYGLFAFSPLLAVALAAPFTAHDDRVATRGEVLVALTACAALWLFSSANQFAHLQWNTGVRYLVPAVPLLFVIAIPVFRAMWRPGFLSLAAISGVISVVVAMMREDVVTSLGLLVTTGPTLPTLIVLQKTAAAYAPFLAGGLQPWGVLAVTMVGIAVWMVWLRADSSRADRDQAPVDRQIAEDC